MIHNNSLTGKSLPEKARRTSGRTLLSFLMLGLCSTVCVSAASAEQVVVNDKAGALLSTMEVDGGTYSTVQVTLKTAGDKLPRDTKVSLVDSKTQVTVASGVTNDIGVAQLNKVAAGNYSLTLENSAAEIASVVILKGANQKAPGSAKSDNSNIYAAGAATVAGTLAAVALTSSSSSSGSSAEEVNLFTGLPGGAPRDGAFAVPKDAPAPVAATAGLDEPVKANSVVIIASPPPQIDPNFPSIIPPTDPAPPTGMGNPFPTTIINTDDVGSQPSTVLDTINTNQNNPPPTPPTTVTPPPPPGAPEPIPMSPVT